MSEPLAKISLCVDGRRGPDASCEIVVPAEWFVLGRRLQIELPARLTCASCAGGGCDACGRSGAFEAPEAEAPLELTLPADIGPNERFRVRLPGLGAVSPEVGIPRGHLLLSVRSGEQASRGVSVLANEPPAQPLKATTADPALALRIVVMAVLMSLLFVFLLRFSGWL